MNVAGSHVFSFALFSILRGGGAMGVGETKRFWSGRKARRSLERNILVQELVFLLIPPQRASIHAERRSGIDDAPPPPSLPRCGQPTDLVGRSGLARKALAKATASYCTPRSPSPKSSFSLYRLFAIRMPSKALRITLRDGRTFVCAHTHQQR